VKPLRRILGAALPLLLLLPAPATALESLPAAAPHGSVRLVSPVDRTPIGADLVVAVYFALEPGWHVYWVNPGESGESPRLKWTTPVGFSAEEPTWPTPTRLVIGGIVNFGYEHELLLPVRMHAMASDQGPRADLAFSLDLSWLACRADECIPARARLSLAIPVTDHDTATDAEWSRRIGDVLARTPKPATATLRAGKAGTVVVVVPDLGFAPEAHPLAEFFPRDAGVVDEGNEPRITASQHGLEIEIAKAPSAPAELTRLAGILTLGAGPERRAYSVDAIANSAPMGQTTAELGIAAAFVFAFVGGLLLNLMPCVFPVLSLKVLGFAERAHGDPKKIRAHGWAFTIGVLLSFWVLAGSLLAIRAGGTELGWGFQLQSPVFIALLSYLLFAMGLSLFGLYEVGTSFSGAVGRVGTEEGMSGSFWTGAIATIVATPCTAPFMGPALGFALTQNPVVAMTTFTALAAGMAAPYLLLSYFPTMLARLPRPGPWMERLRQMMAFPLFASALWLAAVFAKQAGDSALLQLLAGALVLVFALWVWGIAIRSGRSAWTSKVTALAAAAVALTIGLGAARNATTPAEMATRPTSFWQPWSARRVAELRAEGRGVFVNFTAAWCLTCQVNEKAIFARSDIRELFRRYRVAALEADWTNEDSEIARTLAGFGRDGVPLYVFYPAREDLVPIVLPQVPTSEDLENAFSGKG
jgi:thiol:disulfide interchange protein/DsbC/DsbD-like thiol-disulfide interchange protein